MIFNVYFPFFLAVMYPLDVHIEKKKACTDLNRLLPHEFPRSFCTRCIKSLFYPS